MNRDISKTNCFLQLFATLKRNDAKIFEYCNNISHCLRGNFFFAADDMTANINTELYRPGEIKH